MPDTRLIAYPVSNPELHLADWWHDPDSLRPARPRIRQVPPRRNAPHALPPLAAREPPAPLTRRHESARPSRDMIFLRSLLFNVAFYVVTALVLVVRPLPVFFILPQGFA